MVKQAYDAWRAYPQMDEELAAELAGCAGDEPEIFDRFYRGLAFGTGGLRGVLGAGTNRINRYTVAKATRGLAAWLLAQHKQAAGQPCCAIAYDSRRKSRQLAEVTAAVLAEAGVQVLLYPELMPTPMLSFAVRHLGCDGGVVITASHNPAKYNGYKVYGADGGQIVEEAARQISEQIGRQQDLAVIPAFAPLLQSGCIRYIGEDTEQAYYAGVLRLCTRRPATTLQVVYSPLSGAGNRPVRTVLGRLGYVEVAVVPEQEHPDGDFPTCPNPNPEEREAMQLAAQLAQQIGADLFFATDPDSDRIGAGVPTAEGARLITGNEMGALLLEYLCKRRLTSADMPERAVAVKTIVTTELATAIAARYKVEMRNVLTGFKYIGEQIGLLEAEGGAERYLFGFEESYGYLAGTFVRDKDAVSTAALICEMAAYCKSTGKTLLDALELLYQQYGYCCDGLVNAAFEGADGMPRMEGILNALRREPPKHLGRHRVLEMTDYLQPGTGLPASNVLVLQLKDRCRVTLRPSGTEPKLKVYLSAAAESAAGAQCLLQELRQAAQQLLDSH